MLKRRRTEIAKIADPAKRLVTYSKRRKGLFKKASELCHLCGAHAAVIVFSPAGKPDSFGDPSAEAVISDYIHGDGDGDGDVVPAMGLTEWVDWIENEWDSCATEEDVESLIAKYDSVRDFVRKKLEDLEKNSSIIIGAGGDSGAGLGFNSENLSDQEIDLVLESFQARCPALFEDCLCDGKGHAFLTSPERSAATGSGRSRVDSTPTCSGFNPDNFLSVSGDCIGDCDHDSFLTLRENSAILGESSGEESMLCDLEGCGFNADEFLNLFEDCVGDSDRDSFLTLPENAAVLSESSGEELMLCDLEGCGFNAGEFLNRFEDCVGDCDRDNFLALPENGRWKSMLCDLEDYGYNSDRFLTLEDPGCSSVM